TPEAVREATAAELLAVTGITKRHVAAIEKWKTDDDVEPADLPTPEPPLAVPARGENETMVVSETEARGDARDSEA
ncbi:MAG TPA: hypothetical protein VL400_27430, partial [Polyangiaceae bacterium]|nr:hypothetical protein [Polyangiaceae bacterium]